MSAERDPGTQDAAVLSIGAIFMGPEPSPWREAVLQLMARVEVARIGIDSPLNVNLVFHVPGSIATPEFEGVRTGSFRKRDSHLMVQAALPRDASGEPGLYLRRRLDEALGAVEQWNLRKDRQFDLSAVRRVIDLV